MDCAPAVSQAWAEPFRHFTSCKPNSDPKRKRRTRDLLERAKATQHSTAD